MWFVSFWLTCIEAHMGSPLCVGVHTCAVSMFFYYMFPSCQHDSVALWGKRYSEGNGLVWILWFCWMNYRLISACKCPCVCVCPCVLADWCLCVTCRSSHCCKSQAQWSTALWSRSVTPGNTHTHTHSNINHIHPHYNHYKPIHLNVPPHP